MNTLLCMDGSFAAALAITGGISACIISGAISTVLIAAGIFAAPALILGAATLIGTQFVPLESKSTRSLFYFASVALFVISCAAVLTCTLALGILSSAFVVPFILVASVITILLVDWGVTFCVNYKSPLPH